MKPGTLVLVHDPGCRRPALIVDTDEKPRPGSVIMIECLKTLDGVPITEAYSIAVGDSMTDHPAFCSSCGKRIHPLNFQSDLIFDVTSRELDDLVMISTASGHGYAIPVRTLQDIEIGSTPLCALGEGGEEIIRHIIGEWLDSVLQARNKQHETGGGSMGG